jgi:hypothetical protein
MQQLLNSTFVEARRATLACAAALVLAASPLTATAQLVTGLQGATGSTVGPDGALYVTEGVAGRVSRVDPASGAVSTFAEGLPLSLIGLGGAIDVVFLDETAYVLVTLVGFPFGGNVDGIYRVDGPSQFTVIADLGSYSAANPPDTAFDLPNGVQYAIDTFRGGFLVTDGHHNRVLRVRLNGDISVFKAFENIVPTGLEVIGNDVLMGQAGPVPHEPANGKVVAIDAKSRAVSEVASGAPLIVDVERGRGRTLFALSQGTFAAGGPPGSPAMPDTGSLLSVEDDGTYAVVAAELNLPTSLEIIDNTAFVTTLTGDIWRIAAISAPPYGRSP